MTGFDYGVHSEPVRRAIFRVVMSLAFVLIGAKRSMKQLKPCPDNRTDDVFFGNWVTVPITRTRMFVQQLREAMLFKTFFSTLFVQDNRLTEILIWKIPFPNVELIVRLPRILYWT